jgi:hypothetical protein
MEISGRPHHYLRGSTVVIHTAMPFLKEETLHRQAGSSFAESERERFNGQSGLPVIAEPDKPRNLRFGTVLPLGISIAKTSSD